MTSHDVVDAVRRITGIRKVGHAGTLDPFATGVLVIGIGRPATRLLHEITGKDKEYLATVHLNATSTTDDPEGVITPTPTKPPAQPDAAEDPQSLQHQHPAGAADPTDQPTTALTGSLEIPPSTDTIDAILSRFLGEIKQRPPAFSAIKVSGRPAYKLARKNRAPQLGLRSVRIDHIDRLDYQWPRLTLRVTTGPGVYIRALARDIGERLGVGGYLEALDRTRVGSFTRETALTLDQLREQRAQP